jgi:hypothetical protein
MKLPSSSPSLTTLIANPGKNSPALERMVACSVIYADNICINRHFVVKDRIILNGQSLRKNYTILFSLVQILGENTWKATPKTPGSDLQQTVGEE